MGLSTSVDIFQEKMGNMFIDLEYVRTYLDDLLIMTSGSYNDHLKKLDAVLQRLKDAGLQANIKKSYFAKDETEYLGYWVTRDSIKPIAKKVEAIQKIATPTTRKQLRSFIGMVNYYRDMWIRRSELLAPLTALTSKTVPFKWTEKCQKAFEAVKKVVGRETNGKRIP